MARKAYGKPQIKKVNLVPKQAVLGVCKINKGGIPGAQGSQCNKPKTCLVISST